MSDKKQVVVELTTDRFSFAFTEDVTKTVLECIHLPAGSIELQIVRIKKDGVRLVSYLGVVKPEELMSRIDMLSRFLDAFGYHLTSGFNPYEFAKEVVLANFEASQR